MSGLKAPWLTPDWPAPKQIRALTTTRGGGISLPPFDTLNLGDHVGDAPAAVEQNRLALRQRAHLPANPMWLTQVHGHTLVTPADWHPGVEADAVMSSNSGEVCAVMSADCLPVLLCRSDGRAVAAVHAGWRGLAAGVVQNAVEALGDECELMAWLGPAIGPAAFEVGAEVRDGFTRQHEVMAQAFRKKSQGKYLADIYLLARCILLKQGVRQVFGGEHCTFGEQQHFYSYRRDGQTGRMVSLIWISPE